MTPVKVGRGKLVHAGEIVRTETKGRHTYHTYRHLCGSGNSTAAHNWRKAHAKPCTGPVTCKKCLAKIGA